MKNPYDHQFLSLLQKSDSTQFKKDFFNDLLSSGRSSLNKKAKTLLSNSSIKNKVYASIYTSNLEEFGMNSFIYKSTIDNDSAIIFSKCLLEIFSEQINYYIISKNSYELLLQKKEYSNAKKILNDLDEKVGISLWSCGQRLLIEEKENLMGEESNYFLKGYFDKGDRNYITVLNFLILSFLADNELKYSTFKKLFQNYIDDIKNETIKNYILSKFSFDKKYLIGNISLVLQIDSQYSIVDMYNDLETIIPIYYKDFFTKGTGDILPINKIGIKSKLADNIDLLQCIYSHKNDIAFNDRNLNNQIIEQYITGDYQTVFDLTREALNTYIVDFDIAYLFCKSAIRLGVSDLGDAPDYITYILNLFKMDNQLRDQIIQLQKELRHSWGLSYCYGLMAFLQNNKLIDTEWEEYDFISQLSYANLNARYINKINNSFESKFYDSFVTCAPNAINFYSPNPNHSLVTNDSINDLRKVFSNINNLIADKKYGDALVSLNKVTKSMEISNPYDKSILYRQYIDAYIKSNDFYNAIKLIVDIYFEDSNMFFWINNIFSGRIPSKIRNKDLQSDIVNVIYEYIINPANYSRQIIAYSNYLDNNNWDTIFESLNQFTINSEKEKFFFGTVCSINLLKRDPIIKKCKKTAEDTRIIILQKMYELYGDSKYTKEIESIRTAVYIKNNLSKINKSRIYVDTEKIYFEHKDEWTWMYNKLHESLQGKSEAMACINSSCSDEDTTNIDTLNSKIECPSIDNQPINILNTLLNSMLKEFLFSQPYGLETHLSSRIRHGYCHEQLTNFLNEQHLLSLDKSQSGELLINTYWSEKTKDNVELHQYVIEALSSFTKKINDKVDEILKKWLRIQWYGRPDGLFKFADLSTTLPVACDYFLKGTLPDSLSVYRDFTKLFWNYMQLILNNIKDKIDSELNDFYASALTELENKLKQYPLRKKNSNIQQLLRDCGVARSKVVIALAQFKDAFSINIGDYNDFNLDSLTHICQQICINYNNDCNNITWSFNTDVTTLFEGKYFVSFVDLLGILLNNAINHSGFSNYQDKVIKIEATEVFGEEKNEAIETFNARGLGIINLSSIRMFSISVTNNLHNSINVHDLEQKLADIFLSIREERENKIQCEGGSGLYKLCNIIENNIEAPYYITYDVTEQNICVSYVFLANKLIKGDYDANINS